MPREADRADASACRAGRRPRSVPRFRALADELLRLPHSGVIHTAPLSKRGVDTLLTGTFGPLTAQLLTDPFHAASGGNPYLLAALVSANEPLPRAIAR